MRHAPVIELSEAQEQQLRVWSRSRKCALRYGDADRVIVLIAQNSVFLHFRHLFFIFGTFAPL